jgi:hypothetical protein
VVFLNPLHAHAGILRQIRRRRFHARFFQIIHEITQSLYAIPSELLTALFCSHSVEKKETTPRAKNGYFCLSYKRDSPGLNVFISAILYDNSLDV